MDCSAWVGNGGVLASPGQGLGVANLVPPCSCIPPAAFAKAMKPPQAAPSLSSLARAEREVWRVVSATWL